MSGKKVYNLRQAGTVLTSNLEFTTTGILNEREIYCPHCKQEYLLKETKIVQDESRDTFIFCKNFPECFGQGRDLEYLE